MHDEPAPRLTQKRPAGGYERVASGRRGARARARDRDLLTARGEHIAAARRRGGARGGGFCRGRDHCRAPEVVIPMDRKAGIVRFRIKVMAVNAAVAIGALVATTGAPWKW